MAIVDCNSFYCSCERVFRPDIENRPVVVLSNNDGCIIARSDEAKQLGVGMAAPLFKNKHLIDQHQVATFSSNYNLYGDMSMRVMETLRMLVGANNVEVYSVDEAFVNLKHIAKNDLRQTVEHIKNTVEMWTGIKVSIGVAATKVLAKVANRLAKKNKEQTRCILILDSEQKRVAALQKTSIESVWGIGGQYAEKLGRFGMYTAYDISLRTEEWASRFLGGITGIKLVRELKGWQSLMIQEELVNKKMIATTRMFGTPVQYLQDIKEAVATYTARAAEKLRRQHCAATTVSVFIVPKDPVVGRRYRHGPSISSYTVLPVATALTRDLIKPALQLTERLFEDGLLYKKAGVTLSGLVPDAAVQGDLFNPQEKQKERLLMSMMDNVNFAMRDDVLKFASSGTTKNWKMQQNYHSPRYTSRWQDICDVH